MRTGISPIVAVCAAMAFSAASCQDSTAPAEQDLAPTFALVQNETVPIDYISTFNACIGEQIHWVGEARYVTTITDDGAGGYHYNSHRNWKATGTGLTSGETYLANFPRNISNYFRGPFPEVYTVVWDNYITMKGGSGGYLLRTSQKLVINGNGEVVQDSNTYEYVCRAQ